MEVIIEYDPDMEEYKLYNKELDILLTSTELFKVLVLFNANMASIYGDNFSILNCDSISYSLDSYTMKQIISSNVNLIKQLNRAPSAFQESIERFGGSSSSLIRKSSTFMSNKKPTKGIEDMLRKRKKFK